MRTALVISTMIVAECFGTRQLGEIVGGMALIFVGGLVVCVLLDFISLSKGNE